MVTKYPLDIQIILVVVQMHGLLLRRVVKFSVHQDHTAQEQRLKFLAVVGIVFFISKLNVFNRSQHESVAR